VAQWSQSICGKDDARCPPCFVHKGTENKFQNPKLNSPKEMKWKEEKRKKGRRRWRKGKGKRK